MPPQYDANASTKRSARTVLAISVILASAMASRMSKHAASAAASTADLNSCVLARCGDPICSNIGFTESACCE